MLIEVSEGEVMDRLTILEIKYNNITDEQRLVEIKKEMDTLSFIYNTKNKYMLYYKLLYYVNKQIWDTTDDIKCNTDLDNTYAIKSHYIFECNQQRFRMKNSINLLAKSYIKEQKSYPTCRITYYPLHDVTKMDILCNLIYMVLIYDHVSFCGKNAEDISLVSKYIPSVCVINQCNNNECRSIDIPCDLRTSLLDIISSIYAE